jgi:hypothetical protein
VSEALPVIDQVLALQPRKVACPADHLHPEARALQQAQGSLVAVAVPDRTRAALPECPHERALFGAEQEGELAVLELVDRSDAWLPGKQRPGPGSRRENVDRSAAARGESPHHRRDHDHVSHRTEPHDQWARFHLAPVFDDSRRGGCPRLFARALGAGRIRHVVGIHSGILAVRWTEGRVQAGVRFDVEQKFTHSPMARRFQLSESAEVRA